MIGEQNFVVVEKTKGQPVYNLDVDDVGYLFKVEVKVKKNYETS